MKLYTEEQVREALKAGFRLAMETDGGLNDYTELFMNALTPIELPTEEEIGVIALIIADTLKDGLDSQEEAFYLAGFQTCAKWMKIQILNQNK